MNLRLLVLILSIGSVTAYGYALGGLMAYVVSGRPNWPYMIWGLAGGTLCALLALRLWRIYIKDLASQPPEGQGPTP